MAKFRFHHGVSSVACRKSRFSRQSPYLTAIPIDNKSKRVELAGTVKVKRRRCDAGDDEALKHENQAVGGGRKTVAD